MPQDQLALEDSILVSQPAGCGAPETQLSLEGSLQAETNALCHFDVTQQPPPPELQHQKWEAHPLRVHLGPQAC